MKWIHSKKRDEEKVQEKSKFASISDIEAAFHDDRDYLHWIALLITGESTSATQAIVDATGLSVRGTGVFRDWLLRWAQSATARAAAASVRELVTASARRYADSSCEHTEHDLFSDEQITSLRNVDPYQIIRELDPLTRSVLVLRGVQHSSVSDCALLLNVSRRCVVGAYCHALHWNSEQERAKAAPFADPYLEDLVPTAASVRE